MSLGGEYRRYRSYGHTPTFATLLAIPWWMVVGVAIVIGAILGVLF